jgi:hypothetical protein
MPACAAVSEEDAMTSLSTSTGSEAFGALWIALLIAASTATTIALACATPFAALAALAAAHLAKRDGLILMALAWIVAQAIGFALHHYPQTPHTLAVAAALGGAALVATLVAYAVERGQTGWPRLAITYVAAFVAFKGAVALAGVCLGGMSAGFAPAIVARQLLRDGAILIGLLALYHALVAIGLPAPRRQVRA